MLLASLVITSLMSVAALSVAVVLLAMNYRRLPARIPKLLDVDTVVMLPASARGSLRRLADAGDPRMSVRRVMLVYWSGLFALETVNVAVAAWNALAARTIILAEVGLIASALNVIVGVILVVFVSFQIQSATVQGFGAAPPAKRFAPLSPLALVLGLACVGAYGVWVHEQLHASQF